MTPQSPNPDTAQTVKTVLLYDEHGYAVFKIEIEERGQYRDTSFNAEVFEITSWEADDAKTPCDLELYLSCYIKWDSCSHVWFGEKDDKDRQDGYLHICGAEYFKRHCDLMNYLYNLAFDEMGRKPYDDRDIWATDLKVLHVNQPPQPTN